MPDIKALVVSLAEDGGLTTKAAEQETVPADQEQLRKTEVSEKKEPARLQPDPDPILKSIADEGPVHVAENEAPESADTSLPVQDKVQAVSQPEEESPFALLSEAGGGQPSGEKVSGKDEYQEVHTLLAHEHDKPGLASGNTELPLPPNLLALIGSAIEQAKTYPVVARKRGLEGTVYVSFHINADGRPRDIEVFRSSGFTVLDNATVRVVRKAAPYPHTESRVEVPVSYQLTR